MQAIKLRRAMCPPEASNEWILRNLCDHDAEGGLELRQQGQRNIRGAILGSENLFREGDRFMKAKSFHWRAAFLFLAVFAVLGVGISQVSAGQKDKDKNAPKINKAEEDAYKAFYNARNGTPDMQIQLGEAFVTKFPMSHYLSGIYSQLTAAYYTAGNTDKMFEVGNKAIDLNPDNANVLGLMAMAMSRRMPKGLDAQTQAAKAEGYAKHAIDLIPTMPKPDGMSDADFEKAKNEELSMAHSGLGLIDFQYKKPPDFEAAVTELSLAVQLAGTPDPVDFYMLGNADVQTSRYKDAMAAYDKCIALGGPLAAPCKTRDDDAKNKAATELSR
jgi:tetratricopeptide (TPR) repeat protein